MKKVLELFAGTEGISNEFRKHGYDCFTVDWDNQFPSSLHCDIGELTVEEIIDKFGVPDVIFMAPDCTSYSLAAISKHRRKNQETGNLDPISEYAKKCDEVNQHVLNMINRFMELNPNLVFWIENPRACLQNMTWMKPFDKYKHLITYCKFMTDVPPIERRMKPTNLWTNIPDPKLPEPCHNGADDHAPAPRGTNNGYGTQAMKNARERSTYPKLLIEHIVKVTDEYLTELKV